MTPLLRKKPSGQLDLFDPVSAATWAAGATATAKVVSLLALLEMNPRYQEQAVPLGAQLIAAAALTPCAVVRNARTKPSKRWSFEDYVLTVTVYGALRSIVVDGVNFVPRGEFALFDATRESAASAVVAFTDEIEAYAKLVKRERAMERLSGVESLRRLAR